MLLAKSLPVVAIALCVGIGSAHASPAEDLITFLGDPDFASWLRYDAIVETPNGGVEIQHLRITTEGLDDLGLLPYLGVVGESTPADPPAVIFSVESLHLNIGMLGMFFGMRGAGEPDAIAFRADGFALNLAAVPGARYLDLLRSYTGGSATIAGFASLEIVQGTADWHDVIGSLDMTGIGRFELRSQYHETGASLPRGEVVFTDGPGRGLTGLGVYLHRVPVEMIAFLADNAVAEMEAADNPEAIAGLLEGLRAEAAESRAWLERFPDDGPAAAAAIAAWASGMAIDLPEHAPLFAAIQAFGETPGQLRLMFDPQEGTDIPHAFGFEPAFYVDRDAVGALIEAFNLTAAFTAAE